MHGSAEMIVESRSGSDHENFKNTYPDIHFISDFKILYLCNHMLFIQ